MPSDEARISAPHRRLTTIFSADVQGYTRLMEADEEGTLATLKRYRDAMGRLIGAHGGRVVNTWGDGLLAEFPSVVEAVRTAVDVQNELAEHNAGRSEATRMLFRIGINLGDVMVEGDDLYGDGVNIAARLQSQASPGGIVIASTVYDQVRNKVPVGFEFLGNLSVKNIEEGVPSYAVQIGTREAEPSAAPVFGRSGGAAGAGRADGSGSPATRAGAAASSLASDRSWPMAIAVPALIGVIVVVVNLMTWGGEFWARWPLLAMAIVAGLAAARRVRFVDRRLAGLAVLAAGVVAVNLLSWHGEFWAKWPLLAFGILAGVRFVGLQRDRRG